MKQDLHAHDKGVWASWRYKSTAGPALERLAMADYLGIVLLVLLSVDARAGLLLEGARPYISLIDVSNGGRWGDWAWPEMCPEGFYANGVSFKVSLNAWAPFLMGKCPALSWTLEPCSPLFGEQLSALMSF